MPVVLIGCTKEKLPNEAPARELYQGRLFLASVAYAEAIGARWFVLSAAHGLVDPDAVIAPYDVTLNTMGDAQRSAWGSRVAQQLHAVPDDLIVLAGETYIAPWSWSVPNRIVRPLEGLAVGARFAKLKAMADAASLPGADPLAEAREFMQQAVADGAHGEVRLSGRHLQAVLGAIGGGP